MMDNQSLQSIQSKLNGEFAQEGRKIVFWYDERKEWVNEIEKIELQNAEVLYSYGNNQFELKYIIEHENPDKNYLIYSQLPKPDPNKDHLLDILLYSREFKADSLSMFMDELSIAKRHQGLLEKYGFFFRNAVNQESFKALDISNFDEYTIPLGVMSSLCGVHLPKIEHLLVHVIANDEITNNKYINILSVNDITDVFWEFCSDFSDQIIVIDQHAAKLQALLLLRRLFAKYLLRRRGHRPPAVMRRVLLRNAGRGILQEEFFCRDKACASPIPH